MVTAVTRTSRVFKHSIQLQFNHQPTTNQTQANTTIFLSKQGDNLIHKFIHKSTIKKSQNHAYMLLIILPLIIINIITNNQSIIIRVRRFIPSFMLVKDYQ